MTRLLLVLSLLLVPALASAQDCFRKSIGLDPVQVTRTLAQEQAGMAAAAAILPRLPNGSVDMTNGEVVFISIGNSNARGVWNGFRKAMNQSGEADPQLTWVDGAKGGATAAYWADPNDGVWNTPLVRLSNKGLTPDQVGAVFLSDTIGHNPEEDPEEQGALFEQYMNAILDNLADVFPNLQIVYAAGNYYGGYDTDQDKTPEPHDYYENLTLQSLQDTRTGRPWVGTLTMWTDGDTPRSWDGLTLECPADMSDGGVHLSKSGKLKFGTWLWDLLRADVTAYGWLW